MVLVGVPGCGKSLSAKALAADWGVPLLRLDMGRVYGSLLGESEHNLRQSLATAEAVSPCVLWIDELEKAFSGMQNARDGGTSQRLFGAFLNWMSDRTSPVFVVATANDVTKMPAEFARAGRFDAVYFVDVPDPAAREQIFRLHIRNLRRKPENFDSARLSALSEGFSGAEIRESLISGLYSAFHEVGREPTQADFEAELARVIPLSRTRAVEIVRLRYWASTNARPAA